MISDRQAKIIKAIVEEYTQTAEPVGSEALEKKYELGVSPATVRNEMADLEKKEFLKKPHTSAGRIPTPKATKFYINQLMKEKELSVTDEVAAKEKIWSHRHKVEKLLQEAVRELARRTHIVGLAMTDEGDLYHAGYANLLDLPEFYDIDVTRTVLSMLDEFSLLNEIMAKMVGEELPHVLIGNELESALLEPCSFIFTDFKTPRVTGKLGVIGPCRLDYSAVIPLVRYFGKLIEELAA